MHVRTCYTACKFHVVHLANRTCIGSDVLVDVNGTVGGLHDVEHGDKRVLKHEKQVRKPVHIVYNRGVLGLVQRHNPAAAVDADRLEQRPLRASRVLRAVRPVAEQIVQWENRRVEDALGVVLIAKYQRGSEVQNTAAMHF